MSNETENWIGYNVFIKVFDDEKSVRLECQQITPTPGEDYLPSDVVNLALKKFHKDNPTVATIEVVKIDRLIASIDKRSGELILRHQEFSSMFKGKS